MTHGYDRIRSAVKLSLICAGLVAATRTGALDPQKAISQYIQTVWATEAGLPWTSIYPVAATVCLGPRPSRLGIEWSAAAEPLNLAVAPAWDRTRLAYLIYILAGIILAWLVVETRTRSLKRRRDELERLVVERTAQLEIEKQGLMRAREALQFQAAHDSLTGLWSRGAILEQLARELERATRQRTVLSVIVGDLDHFKAVNDTYGHLCGDFVLRESALRLVGLMRGYDAVGRYGGEEFLIILPGYDAAKNPARTQELVDVLAGRPFDCNGTEINVTCSFGVTVAWPWLDRTTIDDLIRRADKALYQAKRNGRNRVEFDPSHTPERAKR